MFLAAVVLLASAPVAAVDGHRVVGTRRGGVSRFLGIRYAQPSTSASRGGLPARSSEIGARSARDFGPACTQRVDPAGFGPWTPEFVVSGPVSDDCLFLNIWSPRSARRAPILFWIHGGGFTSGSGSVPIYDGRAFARRGVVVVTVNYRLGSAGFGVTRNGAIDPGALDLIAALRWTRRNIAAFGGDPNRVTIAGQSAGAMLVHTLLSMPSASGLFSQAIAQSGLPQKAGRPGDGVRFVLSPDLPTSPEVAWSSGASIDVPMLVGMTADEETAFATPGHEAPPANCGGTGAVLLSSGISVRGAATWCGRWALLDWWRQRSPTRRSPTYAYLFAHVPPGPDTARWGSFHSAELPYVFGTLDQGRARPYTSLDRRISSQVMSSWVRFLHGRAPWPALAGDHPRLRRIAGTTRMVPVVPRSIDTLVDTAPGPRPTLF